MNERPDKTAAAPVVRKTWVAPALTCLPKLTQLTLQTGTGIPGECGTGFGGSTCF